ncbi:MAG: ribbon-helix-helix protein, CopG family [Solirubrobacteraceae bacterium]|jgi:predicted transcriptional regulator
MRTTIELSEPVYRRLKAAAISRGLRGFSPIVEEALSEYFRAERQRQDLIAAVREAEGAWNDEDVASFERARELAWSSWQPAAPRDLS